MMNFSARLQTVLAADLVKVIVDLGFEVTIVVAVQVYGVNGPQLASNDVDERERVPVAVSFINDALRGRALRLRTRKKNKSGNYVSEIFYYSDGCELSLGPELVKNNLATVSE